MLEPSPWAQMVVGIRFYALLNDRKVVSGTLTSIHRHTHSLMNCRINNGMPTRNTNQSSISDHFRFTRRVGNQDRDSNGYTEVIP